MLWGINEAREVREAAVNQLREVSEQWQVKCDSISSLLVLKSTQLARERKYRDIEQKRSEKLTADLQARLHTAQSRIRELEQVKPEK